MFIPKLYLATRNVQSSGFFLVTFIHNRTHGQNIIQKSMSTGELKNSDQWTAAVQNSTNFTEPNLKNI